MKKIIAACVTMAALTSANAFADNGAIQLGSGLVKAGKDETVGLGKLPKDFDYNIVCQITNSYNTGNFGIKFIPDHNDTEFDSVSLDGAAMQKDTGKNGQGFNGTLAAWTNYAAPSSSWLQINKLRKTTRWTHNDSFKLGNRAGGSAEFVYTCVAYPYTAPTNP